MNQDTILNGAAQAASVESVCQRTVREVERGCDGGMQFLYMQRGSKNPGSILGKGWDNSRFTKANLIAAFGAVELNIGLLLGEPSGGIVDVDLDCKEAVALAPMLLPATRTWGRKSNPNSHYLYKLSGKVGSTVKFQRKRETFIELRSTGAQTIYPGSLNPEDGGEFIEWTGTGEESIAELAYDDLLRCVKQIAAASLIVRHYPTTSRHDAMLALAGGLLRAEWSAEEAGRFIHAIATASNDDEPKNRLDGIATSEKRLDNGDTAKGFPALADIIGEDVVADVRKWLNISPAKKETGGDGGSGGGTRKVGELIKLAEDWELFSIEGEPINTGTLMTVPVGGHKETYRIGSEESKAYLRLMYNQKTGDDIGSPNTMQAVIETLRSKAFFSPVKHKTFVRVGEADGKLYYDLGDDLWRVVEIDAEGWRILDESPVKFIRSRGYAAQVTPEHGGSIKDLRRFINVADESDWSLMVGWLISSFGYRPEGAYANLCLTGTQDASKSTATRLIRMLVDPNKTPLKNLPKEGRDLFVSARHNWLPAYDNVSTIPEALSDAFCRLATGGGQSSRENYTDGEEFSFEARRPVIMNAIGDVVTRPDLVDRTICIEMPSLDDSERKTEAALYADYRLAMPGILGAVFDALSTAIRELPNVKLPRLPRMADLTEFVTAAESALGWQPHTFFKAFEDARRLAKIEALAGNAFGWAAYTYFKVAAFTPSASSGGGTWTGTANDVLDGVKERKEAKTFDQGNFPRSPRGVTDFLKRLEPNFKALGVSFKFPTKAERGADGAVGRRLTVTVTPQPVAAAETINDVGNVPQDTVNVENKNNLLPFTQKDERQPSPITIIGGEQVAPYSMVV